jgi:hypothetical protein
MNGLASVLLVIAVSGFILRPEFAFAGQFDNQCRQAGQASVAACRGAVESAKAGDAAQSGAIGAGSGNAVNPNAGNLGTGISGQQGRISQAQSACQAAKQKCSAACDKAKQQAQSTPDPQTQKPPHSDTQKIPGTKQSSCEQPIDAMLGELGQAQDNLGKDKQASEDTKNASQGGAPQGGKPGGGGDKKDQGQGQNQSPSGQQAGGIECNSSDGARYSDCNEELIKKCSSNMSDGTCEAFSSRYCGSVSGGQKSSAVSGGILRPAFSSTNTTGMVVDKSGEGLGSSYCKTYTAYKFCQQTGRGACPSCVNLQASNSPVCITSPEQCLGQNSPDILDRARKDCPSDPLFLDPAMQKNPSTMLGSNGSSKRDPSGTLGALNGNQSGSATATGGAGGRGSGSSGGGGSHSSAQLDDGVAEGAGSGNPRMDTGVSEGGGGGGGTSREYQDSDVEPFKLQSADGKGGISKTPASESAIPADVAKEFGPSLFSISTSTYQTLCQKQRLNCRN